VPWSTKFPDPIPLPDGTELRTLKEAGTYILGLSKREANSAHWQLAMHCLIEAAEDREPLMHARIGMLRALNFGKPAPERERRARKYKIVK
jgi:hypothetical protein